MSDLRKKKKRVKAKGLRSRIKYTETKKIRIVAKIDLYEEILLRDIFFDSDFCPQYDTVFDASDIKKKIVDYVAKRIDLNLTVIGG